MAKYVVFLQIWLKEIRELGYEFMAAAISAPMGTPPESLVAVATSVFQPLGMQHPCGATAGVQNRHLLMMQRCVMEPILAGAPGECPTAPPPNAWQGLIEPALELYFGTALQRLREGWTLLAAADAEEDDPLILFEHTMVRNLGQRITSLLHTRLPQIEPVRGVLCCWHEVARHGAAATSKQCLMARRSLLSTHNLSYGRLFCLAATQCLSAYFAWHPALTIAGRACGGGDQRSAGGGSRGGYNATT